MYLFSTMDIVVMVVSLIITTLICYRLYVKWYVRTHINEHTEGSRSSIFDQAIEQLKKTGAKVPDDLKENYTTSYSNCHGNIVTITTRKDQYALNSEQAEDINILVNYIIEKNNNFTLSDLFDSENDSKRYRYLIARNVVAEAIRKSIYYNKLEGYRMAFDNSISGEDEVLDKLNMTYTEKLNTLYRRLLSYVSHAHLLHMIDHNIELYRELVELVQKDEKSVKFFNMTASTWLSSMLDGLLTTNSDRDVLKYFTKYIAYDLIHSTLLSQMGGDDDLEKREGAVTRILDSVSGGKGNLDDLLKEKGVDKREFSLLAEKAGIYNLKLNLE